MAQRVCIIGGGVIGLASAYALVREGFDVSLVEA
ncbi:FAD-dependent oxidoreductase, partial [Pseudomonas chlororaphis]